LDTRHKICTAAEAIEALRSRAADSRQVIVIGYFDPVLGTHARRLAEIAASHGQAIVVLTDPPRPILPRRARAELVAALESVEYVVLADNPTAEFVTRLPSAFVIREEEADARRTAEFIRHVFGKQMVPLG
jgi:bifunctional ADP-heptose synthase (sugar kinase/adenylyltransferase)